MTLTTSGLTTISNYDAFHVVAGIVIDGSPYYASESLVQDDYIYVDHAANTIYPYSWYAGGGAGNDTFDLRRVSEGNIQTGSGTDVVLLGLGDGADRGGMAQLGIDVDQDYIVFAGSDDEANIHIEKLATGYALYIGSYRLEIRDNPQRLFDRGAIVLDPGLDGTEPPSGLEGIGETLSANVVLDLNGAPQDTFGDTDDQIRISSTEEWFNANLGLGADTAWIAGKGGGAIGFGGTGGTATTSVIDSYSLTKIYLPGTLPRPDGDADTIILNDQAEGDWYVGQEGASDRIVLDGFDDIRTLADLQLRAFATDSTHIEYRLTPSLTLWTSAKADQFVFAEDLRLTITGLSVGERLLGTEGDDRILGGGGADRIKGLDGADTLSGKTGRDVILGGTGDDRLSGNGASDTLKGGAGKDVLIGGKGDDVLIGGKGADKFVFSKRDAHDKIRDWDDGSDHIKIAKGASSFAELSIKQVGDDAVIRYSSSDDTITLKGIDAHMLDASDFLF